MTGFVDKVERVPRTFLVERKRKAAARGGYTGPNEEQIHRSVIAWLDRRAVKGVHFFHVPNGEFRHKGTASRLKAMGVVPGEPDIVLIFGGHAYGLEIKAPGGKQSPEQKHIEQQWEQAGATYGVAHGLDYALDQLREWGLLE